MGEIYKITNLVNGKIYIGQTRRTAQVRWLEHIKYYGEKEANIPLHLAIKKYGSDNFALEVLESGIPEEKLNEREIYYIALYDSFNSNIGYNATKGGDGGIHFKLSKKEAYEVQKMLMDSENIMSFKEIGKIFGVEHKTISAVNSGRTWFDETLDYPLRKHNISAISIDREVYKDIVYELLHSEAKMYEITKKHNVTENIIWAINHGKYCYDGKNPYYKDIYSGEFPIRKTITRIEDDFNMAFYEVLFTNKSIYMISREMGICDSRLRDIILGKRRKELTSDYILPMRAHIEENQHIWMDKNGGNELCDSLKFAV